MSPRASYDGADLDLTGQHITEAPYWQSDDGETVDVVDDRIDEGDERTENVPFADDGDDDAESQESPDRPDRDGQTKLEDWGAAPPG